MGADTSEREEIDLLIKRLTAAELERARAGTAPEAAAAPAAQRRPVGRWSNVRLLMPSAPAPAPAPAQSSGRAAAIASAIPLPQLPDLRGILAVPSTVTMVRMWVGLAVAHSGAMTFWPYPKTYFWGLVLYLLSLGLVLVASIWGAKLSWDARLGAAHTVALGAMLWGIALGAAELSRQLQGF